MIEILNKLINIVVGSSDINYILRYYDLKHSYNDYLSHFFDDMYMAYFQNEAYILDASHNFDFKVFFPWLFSSPDVIISFIFYIMVSFGIIYFFLIVPFRLIKQLLPKSVRSKKGANKA